MAKGKTGVAHGERMIEVKVRFWTNDISGESGKIVPKHAWTSGVVRMDSNLSHGIDRATLGPFVRFSMLGQSLKEFS